MVYTLGEAAKATGKSKSTISKAIKTGRLSAKKSESGAYEIDPSELHRVYPATVDGKHEAPPRTPKGDSNDGGLIRELQARLEATQERLTDKETVITDLREDRDRWRQQATALLEDKRPRGFWKKLFGD